MRTIVALLSILVCLLVVPRAEAKDLKPADVAGIYQCEGTNPEGKPYSGIVEVVSLPTGVVYARWTLESGEQSFAVGLVRRGLLVLSYYGGAAGTAVYELKDRRLDGEWTAAGSGDIYRERLVKVPAGKPVVRPTPSRSAPSQVQG
jgi:hypothetical protein